MIAAAPQRTIALRPPAPRRPGLRFGHADVLAAIAGLSFLVARFVPVVGVLPPCPFQAALGLPCASCGMTRAFVALAHGDVASALGASPFGALLAACAWAFAAAALARPILRFRWPSLAPRAARAAAIGAVGALLANWAWLVSSGGPRP